MDLMFQESLIFIWESLPKDHLTGAEVAKDHPFVPEHCPYHPWGQIPATKVWGSGHLLG